MAGSTLSSRLELALVWALAVLARAVLYHQTHSGHSSPPLFGDYEAQRHWQEVTTNLPLSKWYHNGTDNDLLYWGLDYPPLTAYHSYLVGRVAAWLDPSWTALHSSRGTQTPEHKTFMRHSVLACDVLVLLPALTLLAAAAPSPRARTALLALAALYPGLVLIDNGHFQYNNVSLGLFLLALALFARGRDLLGAAAFVGALNYKQMELYHALPVFFYLLGRCWRQRTWYASFYRLGCVGLVTVLAFALVWLPFLGSAESALQVLTRIFPFNRGLFEDKVANFWCSLNVVYKLRENAALATRMPAVAAAATLAAALPANLKLLLNPDFRHLVLCSASTALAFFLFSFQVHEKSVLLAALPVAVFAGVTDQGRYSKIACTWFLFISTFSMLPLLLKDGLALATLALTVSYLILAHALGFLDTVGGSSEVALAAGSTHKAVSPSGRPRPAPLTATPAKFSDGLVRAALCASLLGALALGFCSVFVAPPPHLPDLWAVLVSLYSFGHFAFFFLYLVVLQLRLRDPASQFTDFKLKKKKTN